MTWECGGSKNVRTGKWGLENVFHGVKTDKSQLQDGHSLLVHWSYLFCKNNNVFSWIEDRRSDHSKIKCRLLNIYSTDYSHARISWSDHNRPSRNATPRWLGNVEGSKNVRTGKWGLENVFHGVRTDKSQLQDGHWLLVHWSLLKICIFMDWGPLASQIALIVSFYPTRRPLARSR